MGSPEIAVSKARIMLIYSLCCCIWGTTWYAIRVCIGPGGYEPFTAAALRFTLSVAIFALAWWLWPRKASLPALAKCGWIALAGVFSAVGYACVYGAEAHVSGGLAAVISANGPLIVALIAMVTRTERPTVWTIAGSLMAMVGVGLVFHDRMQVSAHQGFAVALLLLSCLVSASSNVVLKRNAFDVPAVVSNTVFLFSCGSVLWLMALTTHQLVWPATFALMPTLALVYLSVFGTVVAFAGWFYLLKTVRLSSAMTLVFVTPVIALVFDAFFEKQALLNPESYLGIMVVLGGVAVTVLNFAAGKKVPALK